jgi:hypothetical protein
LRVVFEDDEVGADAADDEGNSLEVREEQEQ